MKTVLLVLFFSLFMSQVQAQNYMPFPDSAAVWAQVTVSSSGFDSGWFVCANGEDTIINSQSYTKMKQCVSGQYIGAFRNSVGQVYFVQTDSINEQLVHDISMNLGDTAHYLNYTGSSDFSELIVYEVDTQVYNGVSRRTLGIGVTTLIEGVGSSQGFFADPFNNVSSNYSVLYCMSDNDTIRYGYSASGNGPNVSCDFFIGLDELQKENITVYPNPTNDQIHFSIEGYVDGVILTDLTGRTFVMDYTQSGSEYTIRVDGLDAGVYSVLIRSEEVLYQSKFVVQ